MMFLRPMRPDIPFTDVSAVLAQRHGLAGDLRPLYGERDQGFRLEPGDGRRLLVKVMNDAEPEAVIAAQIAALGHLERHAPAIAVPRVVPDRDGNALTRFTDSAGARRRLMVLTWIDGPILGDVAMTAPLAESLGHAIADLGRALRGFWHDGLRHRPLLWDVREIGRIAPLADRIADARARALVSRVVERFTQETCPRLDGLRLQAIHNDAGAHNVVVTPDGSAVAGVIDFGDMVHAGLPQDLSTSISDALMEMPERLPDLLTPLVEAYVRVAPLEPEELAALFPLTSARAAITAIITAWRRHEDGEAADYMSVYEQSALAFIDALETLGADRFTRLAGGMPASPRTPPASPDASVPALLERRGRLMGKGLPLFYSPPLHMVEGQGVWLTAADGRHYLDCYNNVPQIGHCHPHVVEAIRRQAGRLATNTRYLFNEVLDYAARLIATLPPGDWRCLFVNSGSEANDLAWRMAKACTGHHGGLAMEFAYHGMTDAVDAFSPSADLNTPKRPHMRYLPPPDTYRGEFREGDPGAIAGYAALAQEQIADLQRHGHGVASFILDSCFLTNGVLTPPPSYVQGVVAAVRAAGGLFIADEVQSGFGRMGTELWGHRLHGVEADIVTLGKPAGNGFPLGVAIARAPVVEALLKQTAFFSTFGGNNVACAAGIAVLDVIERDDLPGRAAAVGAHLKSRLEGLMDRHAMIGDVRGRGLVLGVDLVKDRTSREPFPEIVPRLLNAMRDRGVLIGSEGVHGNILKLRPPVVLSVEQADIVADTLDICLAACAP
jgi:4-aminobutyrate aminotransferase-like enzyme/Ser/Thr protein kinase RdoA (MazF antagonist)